MNCIYQSIWNYRSETYVAAPENVSNAGSKNWSNTLSQGGNESFSRNALVLSLTLAFGMNVYALPAGGVVAAGGAGISSSTGNTTITQTTQNAAINWQSFGIGPTEAVRFLQPNSASVMLNRVLGSDPSSILGSLSANGKVFLVNPNGILFGKGAAVNVGGLVASTLNITDSDLMAGRYRFGGTGGTVLNQGSINADGGTVALLGASVSNEGNIVARFGTVALAAGNAITLDLAGDGLLHVTVDQGAVNALVQNGGLIQADGGQVLLTARSASSLVTSAVNTVGVIQAQSLQNHNGIIQLIGDLQNGTVNVGGTLDVSGLGAGQTGGSVIATGQHVGVFAAQINASGDAGGGTVLIGGDFQGRNPAVPNAAATYMSADARIRADALTTGNGGKVVLWGNESTRAYGEISARGGSQGGDGGLIETSGHWLDVAGIRVDASAPKGQHGTWLLDPADVTIGNGVTSSSTPSGGAPNVFAPDTGVATANINVADIITALGTTDVTVNSANSGASGGGAGNITVAVSTTPLDWVAPTTLTLNAFNSVIIDGPVTGTNGSLIANAANGDVNVNAATKTTTGSLTFTAKNNVNLNAATTVTTGNITAVAGQNVNVPAVMTVTTGDIVLVADNDGTGPGVVAGGTVAITCGANCLTITTGNLRIRFNPVNYASTAAEITAYDGNLTGAGVLDAKAWVFGNANNKQYDGTTTATLNPGFRPDVTAALPPVSLGAVTNANFDTKNVGVSKPVTFDSSFTDPAYALFAPYGTPAGHGLARANITPAPLTVTASNVTKAYGAAPTLSAFTTAGLVAGETVGSVTEVSAGQPASASVGSSPYAIVASNAAGGSFAAGNYTIGYVNGALTVTPLAALPTVVATPVAPASTPTGALLPVALGDTTIAMLTVASSAPPELVLAPTTIVLQQELPFVVAQDPTAARAADQALVVVGDPALAVVGDPPLAVAGGAAVVLPVKPALPVPVAQPRPNKQDRN